MTPENPLEHALVAAATEPDARPTFYRLMLESPLFTIDDNPATPAVDGVQTLAAGVQLHIPSVEIGGVLHTPIFSSRTRLQAALDAERKYVAMQGRALLEIVQRSPLVLNPGSPYGKQFVPDEIAAMLSGEIFRSYTTHTVQQPTRVLLGQPKAAPTHLTDALAKLFGAMPDVKAAYLAQCVFPDAADPHTMIGVDARGDWSSIVEAVMQTIRKVAHDQDIVDVVHIDDSQVANYMLKQTKPFYRRKRFGLF